MRQLMQNQCLMKSLKEQTMTPTNRNGLNLSQSLILMFNGDWYDFWKIKMMGFFLSQDLWNLVENVYVDIGDLTDLSTHQKVEIKETRK